MCCGTATDILAIGFRGFRNVILKDQSVPTGFKFSNALCASLCVASRADIKPRAVANRLNWR